MAVAGRVLGFLRDWVLAVLAAGYALTLGLHRARHRVLMHDLLRHFGLRRGMIFPLPSADLPVRSAGSVLGDRRILVWDQPGPPPPGSLADLGPELVLLVESGAEGGNVSFDELAILCGLVRSRSLASCFEIGTFDGRTALNLALNVPEQGTVHTLDLPPTDLARTALTIEASDRSLIEKSEVGRRFRMRDVGTWPQVGRIVQHLGDSATFEVDPLAGSIDLVFIDGSHSAEYVASDTGKALALLRPEGGWILWHDYGGGWYAVTAFLDRLGSTVPEAGLFRFQGTSLVALEVPPGARALRERIAEVSTPPP